MVSRDGPAIAPSEIVMATRTIFAFLMLGSAVARADPHDPTDDDQRESECGGGVGERPEPAPGDARLRLAPGTGLV